MYDCEHNKLKNAIEPYKINSDKLLINVNFSDCLQSIIDGHYT